MSVDKYIRYKRKTHIQMNKVYNLRKKTSISEKIATTILQTQMDDAVTIEQSDYTDGRLPYSACDIIYSKKFCGASVVASCETAVATSVVAEGGKPPTKSGRKIEALKSKIEFFLNNNGDDGDCEDENGEAIVALQDASVPPVVDTNCQQVQQISQPLPILLYLHGGGWMVGDRELRRGMLSCYAKEGFFVLNINYGLSPEYRHPNQIIDICNAIDYLFSIKDKFNLNCDKIFLAGDSAGAHLVSLASSYLNNKKLKSTLPYEFKNEYIISGLLLICGLYNLQNVQKCKFPNMRSYLFAYTGLKGKKLEKSVVSRQLSPLFMAKYFPPSFVVMGEGDKLKSQTEQLICTLAEKEVRFNLFIGRGLYSFHVFPAAFFAPNSQKCIKKSIDFLKKIASEVTVTL